MSSEHDDLRFDVALSYSSADSWVAKDIYALLSQQGHSVYCYEFLADYARGFLRRELRKIYANAFLNVVLWSDSYVQQPPDSLVGMEIRSICTRHIEKADARSLAILSVDGAPLDTDFSEVLAHRLTDTGMLAFVGMLTGRLGGIRRDSQSDDCPVHHPTGTEARRGKVTPCSFHINGSYQFDPLKRWEKLGDVLVNCDRPLNADHVYLIPSGACTPVFRHSGLLKRNSRLLDRKRLVTEHFAAQHAEEQLDGFWFPMRVGAGGLSEVPTVYAADYDAFLNSQASNRDLETS